jgi:hypothetical protein
VRVYDGYWIASIDGLLGGGSGTWIVKFQESKKERQDLEVQVAQSLVRDRSSIVSPTSESCYNWKSLRETI